MFTGDVSWGSLFAYGQLSANVDKTERQLSDVGDAILETMEHIAYADEDGEDYYNAVADAFGKDTYVPGDYMENTP